MAFNLPHPETQPGEIWLGNVYIKDDKYSNWKTKRYGNTAYARDNGIITGMKPVFAMREELEKARAPIPDQNPGENEYVDK